jgi:hypothetical protein
MTRHEQRKTRWRAESLRRCGESASADWAAIGVMGQLLVPVYSHQSSHSRPTTLRSCDSTCATSLHRYWKRRTAPLVADYKLAFLPSPDAHLSLPTANLYPSKRYTFHLRLETSSLDAANDAPTTLFLPLSPLLCRLQLACTLHQLRGAPRCRPSTRP